MTMATRNLNTAIILIGFCLCLLSLISAGSAVAMRVYDSRYTFCLSEDWSCPGPTQYYRELGCTSVFKNSDSSCPEKYNCDVVKNVPADKCFINGHEYKIGELLKDEDKNPCQDGCICSGRQTGPEFFCPHVDCYFGTIPPDCYFKRNATSCCGGPEVCPEKDEDRPICIVDGKSYKDGESFVPKSEPAMHCFCSEGYTGENIEPFCILPKGGSCGTVLQQNRQIRENCAPVYYYDQSPKTSCSSAYRCQNDRDVVIRWKDNNSDESESETSNEFADPDMTCSFGNLTMCVGDELNQATDYSSVCVKCVCEVPPVPTCQRLSDDECDVTNHPDFSSRR